MGHFKGISSMPDSKRNWLLFLMASVSLGVTGGMYETTFNNYLSEVFQVSARTRGLLEFPREFPGCSIVVISAALAFLPEVKMAVLAVGLWALGLVGLGLFSPGLPFLIPWMMIWSAGTHLFMPLNQAIGVSVAEKDQVGRRLGQLAGANTAAIIAGAGAVWVGTRYFNLGYVAIFITAAFFAFLAALSILPMRVRARRETSRQVRFVVKRRYGLFYALNVLFGARKQVFITFGPWVLIKVFGQPASTIAMLWIVSSILGIFFKPFLGRLVDSWGERRILMCEALALVFVCLGYASGNSLRFEAMNLGLYLCYACFVADQLLMAVGIARTTYLNKIAETPQELTPTLSLGVSIDHVVSMMVPTFGGILWARAGYEWVFIAASGVALINLFVAGQIRIPGRAEGGVLQRMAPRSCRQTSATPTKVEGLR